MRSNGPSPVVPFLIVGALWLLIFGPSLLAFLENVLLLFQATGTLIGLMVFWLLVFLLLASLIFTLFPSFKISCLSSTTQQSCSSDGEGFGLGTVILIVLFFVLFNCLSSSNS
ncbi:hypothetical protein SLA2020_227790 [Shorea laevis]